jgi:Cu/Ag efflux pump CusA
MLERIIRASIAHRWLVLLLALGLSALGFWNYSRLPIDAVPDITNVQVQINTEAPGYSPLESEQRVTFPVETALAGLARLQYTRSISRYGLSQVTVVFEDVRSRPGWAKSSCTRSKPNPAQRTQTARHGRPLSCAPCRTGWCVRSCAI